MVSDTSKNSSSFKKILEDNLIQLPNIGDIIKGEVVSVSKKEMHIDIEGVTTGMVRGWELIDESGEYSKVKVGDIVSTTVLELENEKGEMELSLRRAGHQKAWKRLAELCEKREKIEAKVIEANKGGLLVLVGRTKGFLPVSQLAPGHYPRVSGGDKHKILEKLKSFIGLDLTVEIIDLDENESRLIVSEKRIFQESQKEELSKYKIGDTIKGIISSITNFGAFIKFDNSEGLIHISEIAWQRIDKPEDLIKIGDKVKAQIIEMDGTKIFLSIKRLLKDPWKNVGDKYKVGDIVDCKILKINPFGLFVELDKYIHGLAHISEVTDGSINELKDKIKIGDKMKFKILSIEPDEHRLGLSAKAAKEGKAKKGEKGEKEEKDKKLEKKSEKKDKKEKDSKIKKEDKKDSKEKKKKGEDKKTGKKEIVKKNREGEKESKKDSKKKEKSEKKKEDKKK
ncbi:S1 RNA-binding domain-containing protein [Candidatus Parcubacteria bacterium]|nr:S1 RNA-binding domain-containing protein [Candidatus Parcubacteria bacterium]